MASPQPTIRLGAQLPEARSGRSPGPRAIARPERDLSGPELQDLADKLAARPELWGELVRHDARRRVYEALFADAHVSAWLICWMYDQDSGFHVHVLARVAVEGGCVVVSDDGLVD